MPVSCYPDDEYSTFLESVIFSFTFAGLRFMDHREKNGACLHHHQSPERSSIWGQRQRRPAHRFNTVS